MPTVMARARKNTPVTPVIEISGRKTTIGVIVDPTSGLLISRIALRMASARLWPASRCMHDVLDHHDGVVDHQADRGRQAAQRHQVEALAEQRRVMNVTATVAGMTRPATSEVPQSRRNTTMMMEARIRPIRIASRTLCDRIVDDFGLVVEGLQLDAGRQRLPDRGDLGVHLFRHAHRVAVRLPVDIEQHGRFAVRRDHRVDRAHGLGCTPATSPIRTGNPAGVVFTAMLPISSGVRACPLTRLRTKLMVGLDQAGRIDHVAAAHGLQQRGHGDRRLPASSPGWAGSRTPAPGRPAPPPWRRRSAGSAGASSRRWQSPRAASATPVSEVRL